MTAHQFRLHPNEPAPAKMCPEPSFQNFWHFLFPFSALNKQRGQKTECTRDPAQSAAVVFFFCLTTDAGSMEKPAADRSSQSRLFGNIREITV
jgi:hypothetical protein